jgi:hypothetical protein
LGGVGGNLEVWLLFVSNFERPLVSLLLLLLLLMFIEQILALNQFGTDGFTLSHRLQQRTGWVSNGVAGKDGNAQSFYLLNMMDA